MKTPSRYWRIARSLSDLQEMPTSEISLPDMLVDRKDTPRVGDGVLLADYDIDAQTGMVRYIGIINTVRLPVIEAEWQATEREIWVDTPAGRGFWKNQPGFKFADTKVAGYGLHDLFAEIYPDLDPREIVVDSTRGSHRHTRRRPRQSGERFDPREIIGEPSDAPRGGYVYVLESQYGYKVGRTTNIQNRMRAFGVRLPFIYTIPLVVWFDDHYEAETMFHRLFADKHINGEWFDLDEPDIDRIRRGDY